MTTRKVFYKRCVLTFLFVSMALGVFAGMVTNVRQVVERSHFSLLKYNSSGTAYMKGGLCSSAVVSDFDGDGDDDVEIPGAKNLPAPVGVRVWRHGGKLHVVAVNSSREKVSCQLDLGAGLSRRSLALDLAPIETRFFELPAK